MPETWSRYFEESGVLPSLPNDLRASQRRAVRTYGLLRIDGALPAIPRNADFMGVYTKDFSKNAVGFISPIQLYPTERLRLILPTFWLSLFVIRCRRHNSRCYEVGAKLLQHNAPDETAFSD
ncbi:MAG TPA: hypothetical protein DDZ51_10315 [Planctomycetaceae bacterium]|nr:hypothetical protein [Planctomycetaceae bacterium]